MRNTGSVASENTRIGAENPRLSDIFGSEVMFFSTNISFSFEMMSKPSCTLFCHTEFSRMRGNSDPSLPNRAIQNG